MSPNRRLFLGCLLLAGGIALHQALLWHLAPVRHAKPAELRQPLLSLPLQLQLPSECEAKPEATEDRTWQGSEHRARAEVVRQTPFADEVLLRAYQRAASPPRERGEIDPADYAVLYAIYSRRGEDRNHHPEICVGDVQGAREDVAHRKMIHLQGNEERPVQRFRFQTGTDSYTVIYYWHYELGPARNGELSYLQQVYRRHGPRPPSVTVQVTTLASPEQLEALESSLLVAVDRGLRETVLPADIIMACDRLPITLIRR